MKRYIRAFTSDSKFNGPTSRVYLRIPTESVLVSEFIFNMLGEMPDDDFEFFYSSGNDIIVLVVNLSKTTTDEVIDRVRNMLNIGNTVEFSKEIL